MTENENPDPISLAGTEYIHKHNLGWAERKSGKKVSESLGAILDAAVSADRKQNPAFHKIQSVRDYVDRYLKGEFRENPAPEAEQYAMNNSVSIEEEFKRRNTIKHESFNRNETTPRQGRVSERSRKLAANTRRYAEPKEALDSETPEPIQLGSKTFTYRNNSGWYDKASRKKVSDPIAEFLDNEQRDRQRHRDPETSNEEGMPKRPGFLGRALRGTGAALKQGAKNFAGNTALNFAEKLTSEIPLARHFLNPALGIGRSWGGGGNYNGVGSIFSPNSGRAGNQDYTNVLTKILTTLVSINQNLGGAQKNKFGSNIVGSSGSGNNPLSGIAGKIGAATGGSALGRLARGALSGVTNFAGKVLGKAQGLGGGSRIGSIFDSPTVNSVIVDIDKNALQKLQSIFGGNTNGVSGLGGILPGLKNLFKSFLIGLGELLGFSKIKAFAARAKNFVTGSAEGLAEGVTRDAKGVLRDAKGRFVSAENGVAKVAKPNIVSRAGTAAKGLLERVPGGKGVTGAARGVALGAGKIARFAKGLTKIPFLGPLLVGGLAIKELYDIQSEVDSKQISEAEGHKKAVGVAGKSIGTLLGGAGGAELGAALGSVVPGFGTVIGGLAGGIAGAFAGDAIGEYAADKLYDHFVDGKQESASGKGSANSSRALGGGGDTPRIVGKPASTPMMLNSHSKMNSNMRDSLSFGSGSSSKSIVNAPATTINNNTNNNMSSALSGERGSLDLGSVI